MAGPGLAPGADAPPADTHRDHRFRAMGTTVHIRLVGGPSELTARAEEAVRAREARWSRFQANSELSRLNAATGRPVIVSSDTFALVTAAVEAHRLTAGAFDPTVLSTLVAAGYDRSLELLDPPGGVDNPTGTGRPAPGPAGIELHPEANAIVLPPGVGLDLGGIAKGATADAVSAELMDAGADGCCVNVGGDLRVRGAAPDGAGWVIGLDRPGARHATGIEPGAGDQVRLADGAVCTSTVLTRRWAGPGGSDEHHLRHPRSGAALRTGLWSVTVVAASAIQAEVLTKAAFVAGASGAAAVIETHGATGVLVAEGGAVVPLAGLDRFLVR